MCEGIGARRVGKRSVDQRRHQPHLCLRAAQFVQTNQENDPGDTFSAPHTTCMRVAEPSSCLVMRWWSGVEEGVVGVAKWEEEKSGSIAFGSQTSAPVTLICSADPVSPSTGFSSSSFHEYAFPPHPPNLHKWCAPHVVWCGTHSSTTSGINMLQLLHMRRTTQWQKGAPPLCSLSFQLVPACLLKPRVILLTSPNVLIYLVG